MNSGETLGTGQHTRRDALFLKDPDVYYEYALEWCAYPHWTIDEAANLLTGCVPHRPMFLRGRDHRLLDEAVLANENRLRGAINQRLTLIKSKKYFGKTYLLSEELLLWAQDEQLSVPADLLKAHQFTALRKQSESYTTPTLEAVDWVVANFWEEANLREPPTAGAIIQALLEQFPELSGEECDLIEKVTRHPLARH